MGFADAYLLKAGLRDKLIQTEPHPGLKIIITIPVHDESGLERCLDSLFLCQVSKDLKVEVLILINAAASSPEPILSNNQAVFRATRQWIADHPHPSMGFHLMLDHAFDKKEAGVGLARKILMDEAVRRFSMVGNARGIIASLDADVVVDPNYMEAVTTHLRDPLAEGCSIYFEHPTDERAYQQLHPGESYDSRVCEAIIQYELHLRYYRQSVRNTGYPHAFHTVGSSFAVKADAYCKEGGMNRRQGGEDFYFIQKVAQRGFFSECLTTRVIPSPRPSTRVPFGTGPVVEQLMIGPGKLSTYHPLLFPMLRDLFAQLEDFFTGENLDQFISLQTPLLQSWLELQQFNQALQEIRKNSASLKTFRKRFWRWFNMFRIMKFLHYGRDRGYQDIPIGAASMELLRLIEPEGVDIPSDDSDLKILLRIFRNLDRSGQPH